MYKDSLIADSGHHEEYFIALLQLRVMARYMMLYGRNDGRDSCRTMIMLIESEEVKEHEAGKRFICVSIHVFHRRQISNS